MVSIIFIIISCSSGNGISIINANYTITELLSFSLFLVHYNAIIICFYYCFIYYVF